MTEHRINLFKPYYADIDGILMDLKEIMETGWTGLNGKTEQFEKAFAAEVKANFAVGVNSATAALHLALVVAGVKAGDEVITTPMTFVSTNNAILYQNAVPVWCDVNGDMAIDYNEIPALITEKTKAIMVVHYSGLPVYGMEYIYDIAEKHNLWVIEDAAHACGAYYDETIPVGSNPYQKSLTCFSFHSVKNLNTADGGMIATNFKHVADKLKKLRWLGIDKSTFVRSIKPGNKGYNWMYNVDMLGYKYHMNDITAVIGLNQIKYLMSENAYRKILVDRYKQKLEKTNVDYVGKQADSDFYDTRVSSNHMFVIKVDNRNSLIKKLNENNVFPGVHYFPNHLYPIYKKYYRKLVTTETQWLKLISLPLHLEMTIDDVDYICDIINGGW